MLSVSFFETRERRSITVEGGEEGGQGGRRERGRVKGGRERTVKRYSVREGEEMKCGGKRRRNGGRREGEKGGRKEMRKGEREG